MKLSNKKTSDDKNVLDSINFIKKRKEEKIRIQKEKEERERKERQKSLAILALMLVICFSILGARASREKNAEEPNEQDTIELTTPTPEPLENKEDVIDADEKAPNDDDAYRTKIKEMFSTSTCGFDYVFYETGWKYRYKDYLVLDFDNMISIIVKKYTPKTGAPSFTLQDLKEIQGSYESGWILKGYGSIPDCTCNWDANNSDTIACLYSNGNTMGEFRVFDEKDDFIESNVKPLINKMINTDLDYFKRVIK